MALWLTYPQKGALWGLTWRARTAAWLLRHRRTLDNALA